MQENTLTFQVDVLGNDVLVATPLTRYEEAANRSVYVEATHTPDYRKMMTLYRTFPTKSGNFKGVSKSAIKLTRDVDVAMVDNTATVTSPIIGEMSFSIPVGSLGADIEYVRQMMIACLNDPGFMNKVNVKLEV